MFLVRLACPSLALAIFAAGCGHSPTGPTATVPPVIVGVVSQVSPPVPPRISVNPPRALGVTRFVAFGDSITWGAHSGFDARFLFAAANGGYVERLQAGLNVHHAPQTFTVINEGQPGELALNAVARFRDVLRIHRPQVVLLLEGINDLNNEYSPTLVAGALRQMLDVAAAAGIPVVIATMYQTYPAVDPEDGPQENGAHLVPAFNAEIRRLATGRLNVHLVDLERVMRERRFVGNDGLHPEDAGFEVMASSFLAAIEAAFPVRGSFQ